MATPETATRRGELRGWWLVALLCVTQVLSMLDNATFPALIPVFQPLWSLSGTEAGWVSGIYYAGYAAAVPLLVTMTDRFDARAVYLACCLAGGARSEERGVGKEGVSTCRSRG